MKLRSPTLCRPVPAGQPGSAETPSPVFATARWAAGSRAGVGLFPPALDVLGGPLQEGSLRWVSRASSRFSRTVNVTNAIACWKVRARPNRLIRAARIAAMAVPAKVTVPLVARWKPETTLNSVVLPDPFGPTTARISPAFTSTSTSQLRHRREGLGGGGLLVADHRRGLRVRVGPA